MTENDYIAEYVKERHKDILGLDFAIWKTIRAFSEVIKGLSKTITSVDIKNEKKEAQREKLEAEERGY